MIILVVLCRFDWRPLGLLHELKHQGTLERPHWTTALGTESEDGEVSLPKQLLVELVSMRNDIERMQKIRFKAIPTF